MEKLEVTQVETGGGMPPEGPARPPYLWGYRTGVSTAIRILQQQGEIAGLGASAASILKGVESHLRSLLNTLGSEECTSVSEGTPEGVVVTQAPRYNLCRTAGSTTLHTLFNSGIPTEVFPHALPAVASFYTHLETTVSPPKEVLEAVLSRASSGVFSDSDRAGIPPGPCVVTADFYCGFPILTLREDPAPRGVSSVFHAHPKVLAEAICHVGFNEVFRAVYSYGQL